MIGESPSLRSLFECGFKLVNAWFLEDVAGGGVFFSGAVLLLLETGWQWFSWSGEERAVRSLWTVGLVPVVVLSGTPLPSGYDALVGTVSLA
jgi:hypothetical protein